MCVYNKIWYTFIKAKQTWFSGKLKYQNAKRLLHGYYRLKI